MKKPKSAPVGANPKKRQMKEKRGYVTRVAQAVHGLPRNHDTFKLQDELDTLDMELQVLDEYKVGDGRVIFDPEWEEGRIIVEDLQEYRLFPLAL